MRLGKNDAWWKRLVCAALSLALVWGPVPTAALAEARDELADAALALADEAADTPSAEAPAEEMDVDEVALAEGSLPDADVTSTEDSKPLNEDAVHQDDAPLPAAADAKQWETASAPQGDPLPAGAHSDPQVPSVYGPGEDDLTAQAALPSTYSSVTRGYATSVKNQWPFGTCWAFSTIAAIESSMLKRGPRLGYNKSTLDLSERHLAYFTFHVPTDPLGNTTGDQMLPAAQSAYVGGSTNSYLDNGGSAGMAALTLFAWRGAALESTAPYSALRDNPYYQSYRDNYEWTADTYQGLLSSTALSESLARKNAVQPKEAHMISMRDIAEVKQAVRDYGAAAVPMYFNYSYMQWEYGESDEGGTYYYYYDGGHDTTHLVTIVGWDDTIARERFAIEHWDIDLEDFVESCPAHDGGWLIKNSYHGMDYMGEDYFWLSYEDACAIEQNAYVYQMEEPGRYDNLYLYDGTSSTYANFVDSGGSIANVFTAKANDTGEALKAVSFSLWDTNVTYEVQVYRNPAKAADPTSGKALLSVPLTGTLRQAGIYKVDLPSEVPLYPGDRFAVVVTLSHPAGGTVTYGVDATTPEGYWYLSKSKVTAGQSFERDAAGKAWDDLATAKADDQDEPACCARIKAYTVNRSYERYDLAEAAIAGLGDQTYTGKALMPKVEVAYAGAVLEQDGDYMVSYRNNTDAGTATVTVTGKGRFYGTQERTFTIKPLSLKKAKIAAIAPQGYTGRAVKPSVTVTLGTKTLRSGKDYTVSYASNTKVGKKAKATVTGKGNYTDSVSASFEITKAPVWEGATSMPVSSTAIYRVQNGSVRVKKGSESLLAWNAKKKELTAKKAGTGYLELLNGSKKVVLTRKVTVYALTSSSWEFQSMVDSTFVLDIRGKSTANSARMITYTRNGGKNQRYQFRLQKDGSYQVVCVHSGKCLDVQGGGTKKSQAVIQYTWNGGANQKWHLTVDSSNYVTFVNAKSGMCFDVQGGVTKNSAFMIQWPSNGGANQKWKLNKK